MANPAATGKHSLRRLYPKILALAISALAALAVAEFAVRKFLPWYDPTSQLTMIVDSSGTFAIGPKDRVIQQSQPGTGKVLAITYNRHGFRDDKDLTAAKLGDLFVVGDSYSFGWGVADGKRYADLLGQPAYNLAIPGNDIAAYVGLTSRAVSLGAKPGALLVGICMENDLRDYRQPWSPPRQQGFRLWLRTRSALYTALSYELQKRPGVRGFFQKIGLARAGNSGALLPSAALDEASLQSCVEEVGRLRPLCQRVIALIIPSRALWAGDARTAHAEQHERFVAALRQAGLEVIDLRAAMERGGKPLQYHFEVDAHWNEEGHALAAKEIAAYLSERPR